MKKLDTKLVLMTHLAPQNNHLNLSFVKDEIAVNEKMVRNGPKRPFINVNVRFISDLSLVRSLEKKSSEVLRAATNKCNVHGYGNQKTQLLISKVLIIGL